MTHWVKFSRSHDHLTEIERVIAHFLDMQPYRIVGERAPGPPYQVGSEFTFTAKVFAPVPVPPQLPSLIGDCLSNLRASLDHLIYAIAVSHTRNVVRSPRNTQFAIYDKPEKFSAFRRKVGKDLPPDVLNRMELLQPYYGLPEDEIPERYFRKRPLWWLSELVNADKHRAVMPVTRIRTNEVEFIGTACHASTRSIAGAFGHGDEMVRFTVRAEAPDADVTVKCDLRGDVAFDRERPGLNRPVLGTLQTIRNHIRDEIFPVFEAYL